MLAALLVATVAAASAATPSPRAVPQPVPESTAMRLKKVGERRKALEREIAGLRGAEKSLLRDVEELDLQVRLREQELREIQLTLRRTREEQDDASRRAQALDASLAAARPQVIARARALYKLGEFSYMRLLLSVDHPVDVLRALRFVSTLAREDKTRVARFRRDLTTLEATRVELEGKRAQMLEERGEADRRRQALSAERKQKTSLLTRIVEKKEVHLAYAEELQEAEAKLSELVSGGEGAFEDVSVPIGAFRGTLPWPVQGGKVRIGFGPRRNPRFDTVTAHNGLEIEAPPESLVHAVHEGTVAFAGRFLGYGLMVVLDHGHKHHTLYAHLSEITVALHDHVAAGDVLGNLPDANPDLYFEFRFQGKPVDPEDWLLKPDRR